MAFCLSRTLLAAPGALSRCPVSGSIRPSRPQSVSRVPTGRGSARRGRAWASAADAGPEAPASAEASPSSAGEARSDGEASDGGLSKEVAKAVKKTATTFAPRASTKSKNPATPGTALYSIFEVQAYVSMAFGGLLSFNLLFPSSDPDIWRLMGMWSIWMFTIPSLRARDCSDAEKSALNYLFLAVPLINVTLPLLWKSFAAVWTADLIAFFGFYAWKLEWFKAKE